MGPKGIEKLRPIFVEKTPKITACVHYLYICFSFASSGNVLDTIHSEWGEKMLKKIVEYTPNLIRSLLFPCVYSIEYPLTAFTTLFVIDVRLTLGFVHRAALFR